MALQREVEQEAERNYARAMEQAEDSAIKLGEEAEARKKEAVTRTAERIVEISVNR